MGLEDTRAAARMELCARIDTLARGLGRADRRQLAMELDTIRCTAVRHGIVPAVTVIHALERALACGERGPMVASWLDTLREVCGCESVDARAEESFAAAVSVRLG